MQGEKVSCPSCENVTYVPDSTESTRPGAGLDPATIAAIRASVGAGGSADDKETVLHDTACLDCGYNLKGLPLDGTCPECGMWVKRSVFTSSVEKPLKPRCSRLVYIILGLFTGFLGIHNFAAGFIGRGLFEMFLTFVAICSGALIAPFGAVLLLGLAFMILLELAFQTKDANGIEMS